MSLVSHLLVLSFNICCCFALSLSLWFLCLPDSLSKPLPLEGVMYSWSMSYYCLTDTDTQYKGRQEEWRWKLIESVLFHFLSSYFLSTPTFSWVLPFYSSLLLWVSSLLYLVSCFRFLFISFTPSPLAIFLVIFLRLYHAFVSFCVQLGHALFLI